MAKCHTLKALLSHGSVTRGFCVWRHARYQGRTAAAASLLNTRVSCSVRFSKLT